MTLDRYETSAVRRRLEAGVEPRGEHQVSANRGVLFIFLFGCPFVGVGTWIILVGTKVIPVDPATVHAPYWVLTVAGLVFALSGLALWVGAVRQLLANRRRQEAARRYSSEPALLDYAWNPRGFKAARWKRPIKAAAFAGFLTLFLSMFNWWAFVEGGPWMVKIIVGLFDLVLFVLWWATIASVAGAIKFGGSQIEFAHFPYRLPEPIVIRWEQPTGIVRVNKGSFTLRCVEEWFERGGGKNDDSRHLVHEEVWSGTWHLEEPRPFDLGKWMELRFEPPADAPSTQLSAERPVFWELEVKLDLPGLDFKETYLVPIYSAH